MKVYVVIKKFGIDYGDFDYEGTIILSIFSNTDSANKYVDSFVPPEFSKEWDVFLTKDERGFSEKEWNFCDDEWGRVYIEAYDLKD